MAITVKKLKGSEIPKELRGPDVSVVYRVIDDKGIEHYCADDVEAAQLAVELSDKAD